MGLMEAFADISLIAIIVFVAGLILVALEMFMPGFGVAGGLGVVCLIVGVVLTAKTAAQALLMCAVIVVIAAVLLMIILRSASRGRLSRTLILKDSTDRESGFSAASDMKALVGKVGVALTALRPAGTAEFDGVRLDVVTSGEFIRSGSEIEVIETSGNRIVVRECVKV